MKESLLSVIDVDITPVAMDVYGQVKSASVRLKLLRRLIPISELSMERNGGSYGVVFHSDTIQDRDDYKDLDKRHLLTIEEIVGQSWTVTNVAATYIQSILNVASLRVRRLYMRAWGFHRDIAKFPRNLDTPITIRDPDFGNGEMRLSRI